MRTPFQYEIKTIDFAKQRLTLPAIVAVSPLRDLDVCEQRSEHSEIMTSLRSMITDDGRGIHFPPPGFLCHDTDTEERSALTDLLSTQNFCGKPMQILPMLPPLSAILSSSSSERMAYNGAAPCQLRPCDASSDTSTVRYGLHTTESLLDRLQSTHHSAARAWPQASAASDAGARRPPPNVSAHSSSSSFSSAASSSSVPPAIAPYPASLDGPPCYSHARAPSRSPPPSAAAWGDVGEGLGDAVGGDGGGLYAGHGGLLVTGDGGGLYAGLMAVLDAPRRFKVGQVCRFKLGQVCRFKLGQVCRCVV
jgi:hypothetical protein